MKVLTIPKLTSEQREVFNATFSKCRLGGFFDPESDIRPPFGKLLLHERGRFISYILSIDNILTNPRAVHVALAHSPKFNAVAFDNEGASFIGITWGTIFLVYAVFFALLSHPQVCPSVGHARRRTEIQRFSKIPLTGLDLAIDPTNPFGFIAIPQDVVRRQYAEFLARCALDFIFAHELQHIEGGHTGLLNQSHSSELVELEPSDISRSDPAFRQALEVDADAGAARFSLKLATDFSNDKSRVRRKVAPIFKRQRNRVVAWSFAINVILWMMEEAVPYRLDWKLKNHPPAIMRQYFLSIWTDMIWPDKGAHIFLRESTRSRKALNLISEQPLAAPANSAPIGPAFAVGINELLGKISVLRPCFQPFALRRRGSSLPSEWLEAARLPQKWLKA